MIWNNMMHNKKAVLISALVIAALLLSAFPAGSVEYKPGEKIAEDLFNRGIGKPWVGGDSPKSTYATYGTWPKHPSAAKAITPYSTYEFIGYLNVGGSMSIIGDSGDSIQLMTGPGCYPVYGYYLGGRLVGVVIDLSESRRPVQVYPY